MVGGDAKNTVDIEWELGPDGGVRGNPGFTKACVRRRNLVSNRRVSSRDLGTQMWNGMFTCRLR